jgi:hypothetical protein
VQYWFRLLALLVAVQLGCRPDEPAAPAKCDLDKLSALSQELSHASELDAAIRVRPGLVDACSDAVPSRLTRYFQATEFDELAPEPEIARLAHQWLLDQGVDANVAAPIMLALGIFERLRAIQRMPNLDLAKVDGEPFDIDVLRNPNHVVYFTETEIFVDGKAHIVPHPPGPRLTPADGDGPTVIIAAADTRIATISRVLDIVPHFAIDQGGFVVAPGPNVATWIPFGCDLHWWRGVLRPLMSIELTPGGFTLLAPNTHENHPSAYTSADLDAITSLAESVRRDPSSDCALISAAGDVPLHDLLAAAAAARQANWRVQFLGSASAHARAFRLDPIHRRRWTGQARLGKLTVTGAVEVDKAMLERAIARQVDELTTCYHEESINPELEGRMILEFAIGEGGRIKDLEIVKTTLDDDPVERCVANRARRWRLPTAGPLTVSLPIEFELGRDHG